MIVVRSINLHQRKSININLDTIPFIYIGHLVQQQHTACGSDQPR